LRNTVLFAGLGAVWVVTSPSGAVRAEIRRATLVGLALSATVEGLQVFSPVRTASIVDVTTNTLGALVGAGAVALLIAAVVAARGARSYLGVPSFLVAGAYGAAVLCEALTPLFGPAALPWMAGGPAGRLTAGLAAAVLVRAAGVGLGAWGAHRALPALTQLLRGAARARAVWFAYGALLVLWGWRLFMPRTDIAAIADQLTLEHVVPLASLAERVDAF